MTTALLKIKNIFFFNKKVYCQFVMLKQIIYLNFVLF